MKLTVGEKEFEFEEPKESELNLSHLEEILGMYYGYYTRMNDAEKAANDESIDDILVASRMMKRCDERLNKILVEWQPDLKEHVNGSSMTVALDVFNALSGGDDTVKNSSSESSETK